MAAVEEIRPPPQSGGEGWISRMRRPAGRALVMHFSRAMDICGAYFGAQQNHSESRSPRHTIVVESSSEDAGTPRNS